MTLCWSNATKSASSVWARRRSRRSRSKSNCWGSTKTSSWSAPRRSFKLGIQFNNWSHRAGSYVHGFGVIGQDWEWLRMHHYWLKAHAEGRAGDFADYSINTAAIADNKFMRASPDMGDSPLGHIAHAFHFDAALFARFLSGYAQDRGVRRREGKIVDVNAAQRGWLRRKRHHGRRRSDRGRSVRRLLRPSRADHRSGAGDRL